MTLKIRNNFFLSFLFLAVFASALPAHAAELVNINTADLAALQTLPGVGPSIAQSIIDNRPYAAIEEVSRASGIGEPGSSSYEKIKDLITVGNATAVQTTTAATSSAQTQTQSASSYGPPPMTVRVQADKVVTAGGGSFFEAQAYGADTVPIVSGARFIWNFGDGAAAEGGRVFHTYAYPGRYSVLVTAAYNYSSAMNRMEVDAVAAAVSLGAQGDGSLLIRNLSKNDLQIGLWSLSDSGASFVIPEDTLVFAGEGVRFSSSITRLAGTPAAELLYPNGALAAAATVSADSPLRGERVTAVAVRAPAAAQKQTGEVLGSSTSAPAPLKSGTPSPLLWSAGALVLLLAGGITAVHYANLSAKRHETNSVADEFDIEE